MSMRFMRSMAMASLSTRWMTSSWIDHFPGPGRAVSSWCDNPATARRNFEPPASYCSITVESISPSPSSTPPVQPLALDAADTQPVARVPPGPALGLGEPVLGVRPPVVDRFQAVLVGHRDAVPVRVAHAL